MLRFGCVCVCVWCVCVLCVLRVVRFAFRLRFEKGFAFWLRFGLRFETLRLRFAFLRFGSAAKFSILNETLGDLELFVRSPLFGT